MADKRLLLHIGIALLVLSCTSKSEQLPTDRKPAPTVIVKPRPKMLTAEQRAELGFPPDLIAELEAAAGTPAEPFFEDVMIRSSNLKGDVMIASGRLSGCSVRTRRAEEIIASLSPSLRTRGFLLFRSQQNYGNVPDVVTVIRGNSSYDILTTQRTEAPRQHLDTKAIIKWLKAQQRTASFVITGAGADWLEARFITPPKNMNAFARNVAAFAPEVLAENQGSIEKLADAIVRANGFSLWWD